MARKLTDKAITDLQPRAGRYNFADPQMPGHYIRVMPTGAKSFACVTREAGGKQVWLTIGSTSLYSIEEAREEAKKAIKRLKAGEASPKTFKAIAEEWLKRHVQA